LRHSDDGTYRIYQLDLDGRVIKSFASPSTDPRGLAFDGKHLWHCDPSTGRIYQLAR